MTREELIRNLKYTMEKHKNDTVNTFGTNISGMCKDILDYLEQEQEPKTGHWVYNPKTELSNCNNCGVVCMHDELGRIETNYCPNCGAKMEVRK